MVEYSYNGYGLPSSSVNSSYITIASKLEEANVLLYNDISYLDPESIGGLNLYAYCGSNPVMMVDPSGHFFISSLIIGALVGIAIGGGFSIGTQLIASKGDWSQINWMQVGLDAAIGGISGLVAATGIGVLGSAIFGGVLGFGGSVGGDLIANNGDWSQINWGKAIIMGVVGAGIGALCGSGAQNVDDLGRGLMNNSSIKSQFTRLVDAVDNYAVGAISKRGMQGVFNLYGAQFARSIASALPGLVAKNLALNLLKLTGATIATIGINEMFFR